MNSPKGQENMTMKKTKSLNVTMQDLHEALRANHIPDTDGVHAQDADVCTAEYYRKRRPASQINNLARKAERRAALMGGFDLHSVVAFNRHGTIGGPHSRGASTYITCCEAAGVKPIWMGSEEPVVTKVTPKASEKPEPKFNSQLAAFKAMKEAFTAEAKVSDDQLKLIMEEAKRAGREAATTSYEIHLPERDKPAKIDNCHEATDELVKCLYAHQRALLHGPAGTGKSTMFYKAAEAFGYADADIYLISCTAETSQYDLLGARDAGGTYHPGPVLRAFENGGIILLDEFDALDPSTGVVLNAVLDGGGKCSVPLRSDQPVAKRHEKFMPVIAMNTLGGVTHEYTGRGGKQDAATMSRFPWLTRIHVDYDRKIERAILKDAPTVAQYFWDLRDKGRKLDWDQDYIPTTRDFASAAAAYANGCDAHEIISRHTAGWPSEMKARA